MCNFHIENLLKNENNFKNYIFSCNKKDNSKYFILKMISHYMHEKYSVKIFVYASHGGGFFEIHSQTYKHGISYTIQLSFISYMTCSL